MVTTEDICETASVKSDESFPPKRMKLDVIALILGMGDIHNNSNNNNNHNSNNNDTDLEDEFNSLQESVRQRSGSDIVEDYLSLLQRKNTIIDGTIKDTEQHPGDYSYCNYIRT